MKARGATPFRTSGATRAPYLLPISPQRRAIRYLRNVPSHARPERPAKNGDSPSPSPKVTVAVAISGQVDGVPVPWLAGLSWTISASATTPGHVAVATGRRRLSVCPQLLSFRRAGHNQAGQQNISSFGGGRSTFCDCIRSAHPARHVSDFRCAWVARLSLRCCAPECREGSPIRGVRSDSVGGLASLERRRHRTFLQSGVSTTLFCLLEIRNF